MYQRLYCAVRLQRNGVKITSLFFFQIFNRQQVSPGLEANAVLKFEFNIFSISYACPKDIEWVFFLKGNGDRSLDFFSYRAGQLYRFRRNRNKFIHLTGYAEVESRVTCFIGMDNDALF